MSKILIISDSHYLRKKDLQKFINHFHDIQDVIHCGDIYLGFQPDDIPHMTICKGNNDFAHLPQITQFTKENITFTITHGHLHDFAYNPQTLTTLLADYPAQVICFGHTHVPYLYQDQNITIINPGSLTLGRTYPRVNTYAIFDTQDHSVTFYNAKTHERIENSKLFHI